MFEVIASKLDFIKSPQSYQNVMEAGVVKDVFYEKMSFKTILYVESAILFFALFVGSLSEIRINGKQVKLSLLLSY